MKNISEIVHENQYFCYKFIKYWFVYLCNSILIVDHIIKNYEKFRNY